MDDKLLGVDIAQTAVTLGYSITTIESVMGIVILVVQCCFIAWRLIWSVYSAIKNKQYEKIGDYIITLEDDLIALLKDLKEKSSNAQTDEEKQEIEQKIEKVEKLIEAYGNKQNN